MRDTTFSLFFRPAEANYPSKVPPIYLQWRMLRKTQLDGAFLRISIGSRVRKIRKIENTHRTMESEPEAGYVVYLQITNQTVLNSTLP